MRQIMIHKAEPDETGYWAECPGLGVVSQGETIEETITNLREAIELWLEVAIEDGLPIPAKDVQKIWDDIFELEEALPDLDAGKSLKPEVVAELKAWLAGDKRGIPAEEVWHRLGLDE